MLPEVPPFNLDTAQRYAEAGELSDWIHLYLTTGNRANKPLSDGLKLVPRWWVGPLKIPLTEIERVCGPEEGMEFRVEPAGWERYITTLVKGFTALEDFPPLIIHYADSGRMTIRDGNHRYETFSRLNLPACYVFIWFNSPEVHRSSRFAAINPLVT
jgi:hypothetical protein